jgi:uncharacterized damage-inducible protein DinB
MKKNEIATLYQYNAWANARILNAASHLSAEQFLASAPFSYGGLRGTLVHTLFAEWIWRKRWEGHSPTGWLIPEDFPTLIRCACAGGRRRLHFYPSRKMSVRRLSIKGSTTIRPAVNLTRTSSGT